MKRYIKTTRVTEYMSEEQIDEVFDRPDVRKKFKDAVNHEILDDMMIKTWSDDGTEHVWKIVREDDSVSAYEIDSYGRMIGQPFSIVEF